MILFLVGVWDMLWGYFWGWGFEIVRRRVRIVRDFIVRYMGFSIWGCGVMGVVLMMLYNTFG